MNEPGIEAFRRWVAGALKGEIRAEPGVPFELLKEHHLAPLAFLAGDARCRDEYAASAARAAQRSVLLAELDDVLGRARLRGALIKGAAYATRIYDDPAARLMMDVDLLVYPADFAHAIEVLEQRGFRAVGGPRGLSRLHHALTLQRGVAMLDVHRSMLQPLRAPLPLEAIWARTRPCPEWPGLHLLEPLDELLISILHAVRQELRVPLAGYIDIQRLQQRLAHDAHAELGARARSLRVMRGVDIARQMLILLRDGRDERPRGGLLGLPLPSTTDLLRERLPRRGPRILWKFALCERPTQVLGLGLGHVATWVDGQSRRWLAREAVGHGRPRSR